MAIPGPRTSSFETSYQHTADFLSQHRLSTIPLVLFRTINIAQFPLSGTAPPLLRRLSRLSSLDLGWVTTRTGLEEGYEDMITAFVFYRDTQLFLVKSAIVFKSPLMYISIGNQWKPKKSKDWYHDAGDYGKAIWIPWRQCRDHTSSGVGRGLAVSTAASFETQQLSTCAISWRGYTFIICPDHQASDTLLSFPLVTVIFFSKCRFL